MSAVLMSIGAWSQASITVTPLPENTMGNDVTLSLNVISDENVKAFQCDVALPVSMTFNDTAPVLTSRVKDFDVAYKRIDERLIRVLVSSGSFSLITPDTTTATLNLSVNIPTAEGAYNHVVSVSNAIVVFDDYGRVNLPDSSFAAYDIKPSYVVHYMSDSLEVYCDTVVQDKPIVAPDIVLQKEGYTFTGWKGLPATMPGNDITVHAFYTRNCYNLLFKMDNDTISLSPVLYNDTIEVPAPPFKEGHTFIGWDSLETVMPARDLVVSALYSRNSYTLVYLVDGDTLSVSTVYYNDTIVPLKEPEEEGKAFSGWIDIPLTMPAHNLTIKGTFDVYSFVLTYKVDGKVVMTFSYIYGTPLTLEEEPTKEGYTFSGWSEIPEVMPAKNIEITGSFTVNTYKFTYMLDGEVYQADSLTYGKSIMPLAAPVKEGYTFSGWSTIPSTMPAKDVVVTGSFAINTYRLRYTLNGDVYKTDSIVYGAPIIAEANPVKEGYTFSGWSEIPEVMPAHDVNINGAFTVNIYKMTYVVLMDGEVYQTINQMLTYGSSIVLPQLPSFTGYTFNGWDSMPATMPATDITLTASFTINSYLLTYIVKVDGEVSETITDSVQYASPIVAPSMPDREGYTFSGWNNVLSVMPANDVTIQGEYTLNTTQTDEQGLIFTLNQQRDAFVVSDYTDELLAEVTIPETLLGLPVNAIQDRALTDAMELQAITLPATITKVGKRVFRGCDNLMVVDWNAVTPVSTLPFGKMEDFPNMLIFTNATSEVEGEVRNLVVDGIADEIILTYGYPFRNPREFTARNITFTRDFTKKTKIGVSGGWEALVLPFDVQQIVSETRGELKPFGVSDVSTSLSYWLATMQADGSFSLTDSIKANMPFVMKVPNSDEYEDEYNIEGVVTFSATEAVVHATVEGAEPSAKGISLVGSYEGKEAGTAIYALNDEAFVADGATVMPGGVFVADSRDILPFEAYVYHEATGRAPYLRIGAEGSTDIELLLHDGDENWYTLQGVRLSGKPTEKGVYIHCRRVVYIR